MIPWRLCTGACAHVHVCKHLQVYVHHQINDMTCIDCVWHIFSEYTQHVLSVYTLIVYVMCFPFLTISCILLLFPFSLEMSTSGNGAEMVASALVRDSLDATVEEAGNVRSNSINSSLQPGGSATINKLEVPTFLKVVAATIGIFLMISVFVFAVLSKTAFMAIAARLYIGNASAEGDCQFNSEPVRQRSVAFVQLMLALCVPQVVTALRTLFFGVLKAKENFPWPSGQAIMLVSRSYYA